MSDVSDKEVTAADSVAARPSSMRRMTNRIVLPVVFFLLLSLPVLWFGRPSFVPALEENRAPTPFPRYTLFWFRHFERWFDDRFGMRDALVYYGSRLQMARTGSPMDPEVVAGRDGWFFFDRHYSPGHPHFAEMFGQTPLPDSELQTIARNLTLARERLKSCGIPFYLVLAPDKQSIYPEKLWVRPPETAVTRTDQLVLYLASTDPELKVIDLRKPLIAAKATQSYDLYKRTDTHWNALGAFVGYRAITKQLVADGIMTDSRRTRFDEYRIARHPFDGGDIVVNLLSLRGYFKDYAVKLDPLESRRAYSIDLPGWPVQGAEFTSTENPAASGRLLLLRDSFAGELMPFLAQDFNRMYSFAEHRVDGAWVRRAKPDVAMLEIVERNLESLEDGPANLDKACGPISSPAS